MSLIKPGSLAATVHAFDEAIWSGGACERSLARLKGRDRMAKRRQLLLEKLLNGYS